MLASIKVFGIHDTVHISLGLHLHALGMSPTSTFSIYQFKPSPTFTAVKSNTSGGVECCWVVSAVGSLGTWITKTTINISFTFVACKKKNRKELIYIQSHVFTN